MKRTLPALTLLLVTGCGSKNVVPPQNQAMVESPVDGAQAADAGSAVRLSSVKVASENPRMMPSGNTTRVSTQGLPAISNVRAFYVKPWQVGPSNVQKTIRFMAQHDLNGVVMDVKDDEGRIWLNRKMRTAIRTLHARNLYCIARIVVFKDPKLAETHPEYAIRRKGGGLWTQSGVVWVDPYQQNVWRYNIDVAASASRSGFDEIQWDYVRFPDASKKQNASAIFENVQGWSKSDDIMQFLKYAKSTLGNTRVSADVFGLVTSVHDDMGIGQVWEKMSPNVDAISPMMYPSHYGSGVYGLTSPEHQPHQTVEVGLRDAVRRNQALARRTGSPVAVIRPWLQDFDQAVPYNRTDVKAQVRAVREQKLRGYLLWNQAGKYST